MPSPLLAQTPGETLLLLGNEAIVRGALEGGVGFVSCYPGTPSSEAPDTFFRLSREGDYRFEYSTNEKVALEVGAGAALAGTPTLVTMKHVGVNVAADPLLTLSYITAPGGLVLLSADDPGCHSSQNEQDNRHYARLAGLPCFEPATAQECKDMARDALHLAARTGQPVMLRTTTRVNHVRGPVTLGSLPAEKQRKPFERNLQQYTCPSRPTRACSTASSWTAWPPSPARPTARPGTGSRARAAWASSPRASAAATCATRSWKRALRTR